MATKCKTCAGTYNPTQPDGSRYFHSCAPVANPAYQPDPAKVAFNPTETIEHANKRDENLVIDPATKKVTGIVSEGTGVTAT